MTKKSYSNSRSIKMVSQLLLIKHKIKTLFLILLVNQNREIGLLLKKSWNNLIKIFKHLILKWKALVIPISSINKRNKIKNKD